MFNAAVRPLTSIGFANIDLDIAGKKFRRRYVKATGAEGADCCIWIKVGETWHGLAQVLRFPRNKKAVSGDDLTAVVFALGDAARRGASHLLAVIGDESAASLDVALVGVK